MKAYKFNLLLTAMAVSVFGMAHYVYAAEAEQVDSGRIQELMNSNSKQGIQPIDMKSAQPMPWPEYKEVPILTNDEMYDGDSGGTEGVMPTDDNARQKYNEAWQALESIDSNQVMPSDLYNMNTLFMGTPDVYTAYPANLYSQMWKYYPWRAMGKLYFKTASGGTSYCSASVLKNNIVVTAAHCLYTRGQGWHNSYVFIPAYRYGVQPYGQYGWTGAIILTDWINVGARQHDVGLIRLNGNANAQVGSLGMVYGVGYVQSLFSFGYPNNLGSGNYSNTCAAESFNDHAGAIGMGCNMTYGSSGGPWVRKFRPYSGGGNQVNSVVSGPATKGTFGNSFVGPYFSSSNIKVLCQAFGCL